MAACNLARRLKTLGGLTPYEYICKVWTSDPDRFSLDPINQMPGLNSYSSGDIFAASFQDHEIGPVLGVDSATGGGANVWTRGTLISHNGPDARFVTKTGWGEMHIAVRRCRTLGKHWGIPIEEAGVTPDLLHVTTRRDLFQYDVDLMHRIGRELKSLIARANPA